MKNYSTYFIDTLAGPTYFFSGLGMGNKASQKNKNTPSFPKKTALECLEKAFFVAQKTGRQLIFPPLSPIKRLETLGKKLGITSWESVFDFFKEKDPETLLALLSSASLWTANAFSFTPSCTAEDQKAHITPSNLLSSFHRSQETEELAQFLRNNFPESHFVHHSPLPLQMRFRHEGRANELFFFPHGKILTYNNCVNPLSRQSLSACIFLSEQHKSYLSSIFIEQSIEAIRQGVFHNDIIAFSTDDTLFYHEAAFGEDFSPLLKKWGINFEKVTSKNLTLEEVIESYLFNSQFFIDKDNKKNLLVPEKCLTFSKTKKLLDNWSQKYDLLIHPSSVKESMKAGGGPACLRNELILNAEEAALLPKNLFLTEKKYFHLKKQIETTYPEELTLADLLHKATLSKFIF